MRILVKNVPVVTFISLWVDVPDDTPPSAAEVDEAAKKAIEEGDWTVPRGQSLDEATIRPWPATLPTPSFWELEIEHYGTPSEDP